MSCTTCNYVPPIQDKGTIWLIASTPFSRHQLDILLKQNHSVVKTSTQSKLPLNYKSRGQLIEYLDLLVEKLQPEVQREIHIEIVYESESIPSFSRFSLESFAVRVLHHDLVRIISDNLFESHMQPIVDIQSMEIVAYEFLLRPRKGQVTFQPYRLFEIAQQSGLHSFLDRSARISAIKASSQYLKQGIKRFINFLPSSIYNPNYCLSHTFQAIDSYKQDPRDFVFEVVETEKISSVEHLKNIFKVYKEHGIQVALDDVGSGHSTLEVLSELQPDYVKIDRELVSYCDQDNDKRQKLNEIITCARSFGATVLAEGIERKEELEFFRSTQVGLAQGYLFGKPASSPLPSLHNIF